MRKHKVLIYLMINVLMVVGVILYVRYELDVIFNIMKSKG